MKNRAVAAANLRRARNRPMLTELRGAIGKPGSEYARALGS
jgi:hypothetical protein